MALRLSVLLLSSQVEKVPLWRAKGIWISVISRCKVEGESQRRMKGVVYADGSHCESKNIVRGNCGDRKCPIVALIIIPIDISIAIHILLNAYRLLLNTALLLWRACLHTGRVNLQLGESSLFFLLPQPQQVAYVHNLGVIIIVFVG
jgi:hypothetical protein